MRRHEVGDLVEPPRRQLVEYLAPVRHGPEHMVERREAVGCDQCDRVTEIDDVAYLADGERPEIGNSCGADAGERVRQRQSEIETHLAPATNASNNGSPEPPSGPEGRCQSKT